MILAAIDIGTNTLRLLLAEISAGALREIHSDRRITRLGQDLCRTGRISLSARDRSIAALADFNRSMTRYGTDHVAAVGTSALRNASNADDFITAVREITGIEIRVISGEEEARLTLLGVTRALDIRNKRALVMDIGGGSTELILSRPEGRSRVISLPLGAVYLTEHFLKGDPPAADEMEQARRMIESELDKHGWLEHVSADVVLIGTAGTITTLAAMNMKLTDYDPARINGARLSRKSIDGLVSVLSSTAVRDRQTLPGLEPGREDIILAGAVVCREIMNRLGFQQVQVSDWGLREGILFDLYDRIQKKSGI